MESGDKSPHSKRNATDGVPYTDALVVNSLGYLFTTPHGGGAAFAED
jgi:hypothetical protein